MKANNSDLLSFLVFFLYLFNVIFAAIFFAVILLSGGLQVIKVPSTERGNAHSFVVQKNLLDLKRKWGNWRILTCSFFQ